MAIEKFMARGQRWKKITVEAFESYIVGVDLGHTVDPTAICVMHYSKTPLDTFTMTRAANRACANVNMQDTEERFDVVHLERLPLGTDYPAVARHIAELLKRPPLKHAGYELIIDATGVGLPVVQILEEKGLRPIKVMITAGAEQLNAGGNLWHVAKSILISHLDAALHTAELHFAPELLEASAMKDELAHFDRHVTASGRASYAARTNKHDDLVLAVSLCVWRAKGNGPGKTRLSSYPCY
jgi:hypothetical protein